MPSTLHLSAGLKLALVPWLCKPTDVAGCVFWLRAGAGIETAPLSLRIASWTDLVSEIAVTPIAPERAPKQVGAAPELNGLPGVTFDENTELLQKVGGLGVLPWSEAPFSMFAVCAPENVGQVNATLALWAGTLPHAGLRFSSKGEFQGWVESLFGSSKKPRQFKPHVVGMVYDGQGTLDLYVDGTLAATHGGVYVAAQDDGEHSVLAVGADSSNSENFRGLVGDVVIYNRALDAENVAFLNTALQAHYNMYAGWLASILKPFARGAAWIARLIGGEMRHLFGPAEPAERGDAR